MTSAPRIERLESARLVLRRMTQDDLPFLTRLHALPEVALYLYPDGPHSAAQAAAWLRNTLASYKEEGLGRLAVLRKQDGAVIGRCGLSELIVETAIPDRGPRTAWLARERVPAGVAVTFEHELGYTLDPAVWGQGYATEAACCVRDYARDVLHLSYLVSVIHPQNARSRRVAERGGAQVAGQMEIGGLTWDRYVWPLATDGRRVV
jgi:RimJ/RimL family protein N-acetyltransferase